MFILIYRSAIDPCYEEFKVIAVSESQDALLPLITDKVSPVVEDDGAYTYPCVNCKECWYEINEVLVV